jgi:hypothetical protein
MDPSSCQPSFASFPTGTTLDDVATSSTEGEFIAVFLQPKLQNTCEAFSANLIHSLRRVRPSCLDKVPDAELVHMDHCHAVLGMQLGHVRVASGGEK